MRAKKPAAEGGQRRALGRRDVLKFGALAGALLLPMPALARIAPSDTERTLKLYNLNTGESLATTYWADGDYLTAAFPEIDHILRDHHSGAVIETDRRLVDLIYELQRRLSAERGLDVVCGYRSPKTNALLMREGRVHARHSFHLYGQAMDFRVPGRDLRQVRKVAMDLHRGGVGYYPRSHFVHVDVGPVRHW